MTLIHSLLISLKITIHFKSFSFHLRKSNMTLTMDISITNKTKCVGKTTLVNLKTQSCPSKCVLPMTLILDTKNLKSVRKTCFQQKLLSFKADVNSQQLNHFCLFSFRKGKRGTEGVGNPHLFFLCYLCLFLLYYCYCIFAYASYFMI